MFSNCKHVYFLLRCLRCLHCRRALAMRILSVCLSVRLSVCLSDKRVHYDKTEERSVQIFMPYERSFSLVFWEEEWLVGSEPFYLKFWVNRGPCRREIANFEPIFAPIASAVILSEKSSINTNRKSTTRFPVSLRWSSYVVSKSPRGAQKRKTADFRLKSHFAWRKSATKFLCVKTVSDKVIMHSLA